MAVEDWSSCGPSGRGSDELAQQQHSQQSQRLRSQLGVSGLNPLQFPGIFNPYGASPYAAAAFNPMLSMMTSEAIMQQQAAWYTMLQHQ